MLVAFWPPVLATSQFSLVFPVWSTEVPIDNEDSSYPNDQNTSACSWTSSKLRFVSLMLRAPVVKTGIAYNLSSRVFSIVSPFVIRPLGRAASYRCRQETTETAQLRAQFQVFRQASTSLLHGTASFTSDPGDVWNRLGSYMSCFPMRRRASRGFPWKTRCCKLFGVVIFSRLAY